MTMTLARSRQKEERLAVEQYCREDLKQELKECLQEMNHNQMLFDLETEPELIEQRVYEYQALQCRYGYLQRRARAEGLRLIP